MDGQSLDQAPLVNIFDPAFMDDPMAVIGPLQAETWLVRTPIGAMAIGRTQVQGLLGDRRLRSSLPDILRLQGVTDGPLYERMSRSILVLDGPEHVRIRKLVNRSFTPRAVAAHRAHMGTVLDALLAPVVPAGRAELMAEVSDHYPIQVMCHVLGVPEEDHTRFAAWNQAITWALSFELHAHVDEVLWGMAEMDAYVAELMAERRRDSQDDMVTALVQAEEVDDRLSDLEVQTMIVSLLFAGYDTTRNQLGLALWRFAQEPAQWALLAERPELAAPAVEEVMRLHGAVAAAPRVVVEDMDHEGWHLPAGTILTLSLASANRDAASGVDLGTFDITATREPHLTFGGGPHFCLGASLARAEMQEALPRLARALPDLALDGEPAWRSPMGIFGPETLPVRFTPTG